MPLFGPPDVSKLEAKKDVMGLIKAMRYRLDEPTGAKDEPLRLAAVDALARIGQPAVEPLIAGLQTAGERLDGYFAQALIKIGSPAVPLLVATMLANRGKNNWIPNKIAVILGKIGDPRAIEPLIAVLTYPPASLEMRILDALRAFGAQAVEPLLAELDNPSTDARHAAASALAHVGLPALHALIIAFIKGDDHIRYFTALMIKKLGKPAEEALLDFYRAAPAVERRLFAAYLVDSIQLRALYNVILTDPDLSVRQAYEQARMQALDARRLLGSIPQRPIKTTPDVD